MKELNYAEDDDEMLIDAFDQDVGINDDPRNDKESSDDVDPEKAVEVGGATFKDELRQVLRIVWPVVLTMLLQMLFQMVTVVFVGHYDSTAALDATGLGVSFLNVFGFSVGSGLASAVDTLAAQAYGNNNKPLLGLILQRGIYIVGLSCLPAWAIYINAEPFLLALRQDPMVAQLTAKFLLAVLLYLPGMLLYILLQKYLQAMNVVKPSLYIGLAVNIFNLLLCYIFIATMKLGVIGAAICQVLCAWLMAIATIIYIYRSGIAQEAWPGWRAAALLEWGPFLKLAFPGMLMLCVEWWSFEIAQFLAGLMGELQLATQLITLQLAAFAFMVPLGISVAASIRVGNSLGANQPLQAKRAAVACLICVGLTSSLSAITIYAARRSLPKAFTADQAVVDAVANVLLLLGVFQLFDHTQGVLSGILRGCGLQLYGAVVNVVGYYVVGAPVLVLAAFVADLEVKGLWVGLISSVAIQVLLLGYRVWRVDWELEAKNALARVGDDSSDSSDKADSKSSQPVDDEGEDVPMLNLSEEETAECVVGAPNHWRQLTLKDIPRRTKQQIMAAVGVLLAILLIASITSATYTRQHVCYPLPRVDDIPHAASVCDGRTSMHAGNNCSLQCNDGWIPNGVVACLSDKLEELPACVQTNSST